MSPAHTARLKQLCHSNELEFASVYKRVRPVGCRAELRFDGLAGCLRTPRGGSSKQFVIQAGHGTWRVRNMTAREYARLQGVPESFKITVPYNQALFGFGDAVCVPAVSWIIEHGFSGNA
jgi:DNA (cytosine-5)-methyltransferase 1